MPEILEEFIAEVVAVEAAGAAQCQTLSEFGPVRTALARVRRTLSRENSVPTCGFALTFPPWRFQARRASSCSRRSSATSRSGGRSRRCASSKAASQLTGIRLRILREAFESGLETECTRLSRGGRWSAFWRAYVDRDERVATLDRTRIGHLKRNRSGE